MLEVPFFRPDLTEVKEQFHATAKLYRTRKPVPPEQTNAEGYYYSKQMANRTKMVIVLKDGEEIRGTIEWYDKTALKVTLPDTVRLLGANCHGTCWLTGLFAPVVLRDKIAALPVTNITPKDKISVSATFVRVTGMARRSSATKGGCRVNRRSAVLAYSRWRCGRVPPSPTSPNACRSRTVLPAPTPHHWLRQPRPAGHPR